MSRRGAVLVLCAAILCAVAAPWVITAILWGRGGVLGLLVISGYLALVVVGGLLLRDPRGEDEDDSGVEVEDGPAHKADADLKRRTDTRFP